MTRRRLAVVTPWFGRELTGGAERLAYQVARAMHGRGHDVEVFATCGRAFASDWAHDHHAPGTTETEGVVVHRFALDARRRDAFDRANAALLAQPPDALVPEAARVSADVETAFVDETIRSRALEDAVAAACANGAVDRALFVPYLYGPTLFGVARAGARAVVQPCLHDEVYAYLPRVAEPFHAAARLLYNGEAEMRLAARLFGPAMIAKGAVVGHWVEPPPEMPHGALRAPLVRDRYLLYLGRRDRSKNVHLLVQAFLDFKRYDPESDLRLVLAGPGATSLSRRDDGIDDLGFVGDDEKWLLIDGARAIVQPSERESFSRTMLEGWARSRPAIVHGRCDATAAAVRESGAGFVATTRAQWTRAFESLEAASASAREALGAGGRAYFERHSSFERIADRYEAEVFGDAAAGTHSSASRIAPTRSPSAPFADSDGALEAYDASYWDGAPDAPAMRRLADRGELIVTAGDGFGEDDDLEALVTAFAFLLSYGVDASLAILGPAGDPARRDELARTLDRHALTPRVEFVADADRALAHAYYRSARAYVTLAERPSSRIALLDACAFDLPVVAFGCERTRATLRGAGAILARKDDPVATAALLKVVLADAAVRSELERSARARIARGERAPVAAG